MGTEAKGCMYFYFNLYHEGGIRALKIRTQDPDGFMDYIWDLTDYTMESGEQLCVPSCTKQGEVGASKTGQGVV